MPRDPHTGAGLSLPKDVGVSESTAKEIEDRWNTIGGVDDKLRALGIHANNIPDVVCPVVTAEALTTPDANQYTVTYASQLRWYNYAIRILADVKALKLQVDNEMNDIESTKRTLYRELDEGKKDKEKMSATEMKDRINQDAHYKGLKLQSQELEQHEIKVKAWAESLERNLAVVSRQIELRKIELQGGGREGNIPNAQRSGAWHPRQNG